MDVAALLGALPARISDIPRRWADAAPQAIALREGDRSWTYGELWAAVQATAERLRVLGLRPGDRLMVVGENCVAQVGLIFAAALCDAWIANVRGVVRNSEEYRIWYEISGFSKNPK